MARVPIALIIALSLTLSFSAAIGVNLQKLSMRKEGEREGPKRPVFLQPLWCIGMLIVILDACGDFVFIGLAPQSLLAPLGSLSLGWNIILAPIFHNEKVTRSILFATGLIYVGTILTVLFAADTSPDYNLAKLIDYIRTIPVLFYFIVCISFQTALAIHGKKKGFGILHYCGLAGCFGGECLIFTKTSSELVKNAVVSGNTDDFTSSPLPYIFIVLTIGTVLAQVSFLTKGLAKFDALIVVPIFQSFWGIFSLTGGLIFFQEHKYMDALDGAMYTLGVFITLVGVALLVKQRSTTHHLQKNSLRNESDHAETPGECNNLTEEGDDSSLTQDIEKGKLPHPMIGDTMRDSDGTIGSNQMDQDSDDLTNNIQETLEIEKISNL